MKVHTFNPRSQRNCPFQYCTPNPSPLSVPDIRKDEQTQYLTVIINEEIRRSIGQLHPMKPLPGAEQYLFIHLAIGAVVLLSFYRRIKLLLPIA